MKRILLLLCLISSLCSFALETKKVAVLEVVDKKEELSYYQKLMLRTRIAEEVNKAAGFEAYNRTNLDAVMNEQNFQRTGFVSSDQVRRVGEMVGAAYILIIEGAASRSGYIFVSTILLDVESGQMVVTESENMASSEEGMQQGCTALARKVFSKLNVASAEYVDEEKRILQEEKDAKEAERAKYYVYKRSDNFVYMGSEMENKAYAKFLKMNCPAAYKKYNQGQKEIISGWCLFGLGAACIGGGTVHYLVVKKNYLKATEQNKYYEYYDGSQRYDIRHQKEKYDVISYSFMGIGGGLLAASVPLVSMGYIHRKQSVSIYNEQCSSPSIAPISFNLTAGQNGLGIAMKF